MIRPLSFARPLVMGIINVTPDSFSGDGVLGRGDYIDAACRQAIQMIADGADILDIGGESTRPGFVPVSADEECRRVVPVVETLRQQGVTCPIAIDTTKAAVAASALMAGADIINDISAMTQDNAMTGIVAQHQAWCVLMHNAARPDRVGHDSLTGGTYKAAGVDDIMAYVIADLTRAAGRAVTAGVKPGRIILDPGVGFGKAVGDNVKIIAQLDRLKSVGYPVLLGASRKSFIGLTLNNSVDGRLAGTAACVALGIARGADILRVHDVRFMADVAKMAVAIAGPKCLLSLMGRWA